jgi:hypothetical protein
MRLFGQKALLVLVALTPACHETTAPPPLARYVLESVNSQLVPAIIHAGAGDTTTLFSGVVTLNMSTHAEIVAYSRQVHPMTAPRVAADTSRYSYRIVGDSIAFDYSPPCPANALCVSPPYGKITSETLTLFYNSSSTATYLYRLTRPIG